MRAVAMLLVILSGLLLSAPAAEAAPPPWYPPLRWYPASTANYTAGRDGTRISHIVIHATDGQYDGTLSWFHDPSSHLSAHYVIRASDGLITQTVAEADTAFHARGFNERSIGIEHEFAPSVGIAYTDAEYRSSATLVCAIARRYGIPTDRAHIIAHSEIPNTDHRDPGPTWDWTYYMSLVWSCSGGGAPAAGLGAGDDGDAVGALQHALVSLGYLARADLAGGEGHFGPHTQAALETFQSATGVPATGYYGPLSAAALTRVLSLHAPSTSASSSSRSVAVPSADLFFGDTSDEVAGLQSALEARGYMGLVTGYFGPLTLDALRRYQRDHGIVPTGNYGPLTRAALAGEAP